MEEDTKEFLNTTSKKLAKIEKKIQEMKLNIVIMSFYSDLKLIEDTLLAYQAQGMTIDNSLLEKVEKFKILLQSNKNLPKLGKKFIELTEEFYSMRKQMHSTEIETDKKPMGKTGKVNGKRKKVDYLYAYA
jgi:hypothetical protein